MAATPKLTTPDLVLLSLLAKRPMHGYAANAELQRREVRDWAGISRPQVYYSLDKLLRLGLVRAVGSDEPQLGPDRRVVATTARGREALASALERDDWAEQRERPPFLTWMALSWLARPGIVKRQLQRRRKYLDQQLSRERSTHRAVVNEVGHESHEAVWMIKLMIAHFETELRWLDEVERDLARRHKALHPPKD
ncbi:MAG TPA: PadR family transcriptional regulator [Terriglobales bacterium]|nr:PadR family transcriptional regulator [Terriglobales bacterium]